MFNDVLSVICHMMFASEAITTVGIYQEEVT